jgi:hypothetical protein
LWGVLAQSRRVARVRADASSRHFTFCREAAGSGWLAGQFG